MTTTRWTARLGLRKIVPGVRRASLNNEEWYTEIFSSPHNWVALIALLHALCSDNLRSLRPDLGGEPRQRYRWIETLLKAATRQQHKSEIGSSFSNLSSIDLDMIGGLSQNSVPILLPIMPGLLKELTLCTPPMFTFLVWH